MDFPCFKRNWARSKPQNFNEPSLTYSKSKFLWLNALSSDNRQLLWRQSQNILLYGARPLHQYCQVTEVCWAQLPGVMSHLLDTGDSLPAKCTGHWAVKWRVKPDKADQIDDQAWHWHVIELTCCLNLQRLGHKPRKRSLIFKLIWKYTDMNLVTWIFQQARQGLILLY